MTLALLQAAPAAPVDHTAVWVVAGYLALLVALGIVTKMRSKGTASDYFVVGRSIGSFLLLMSVFGTTMTAFAMVGSTAKSYDVGIGVYGLMASSSGLVHSLVFFVVGIRLWAIGKRYGYLTQVQFFRARFQSDLLGWLLFPILVALVVPYLLIGLIGAGGVVKGMTRGMFPETFPDTPSAPGAVPEWLTGLVISGVVLFYIFFGGLRGAVWANTFQTIVFMVMGVVALFLISSRLGGAEAATAKAVEFGADHLTREGRIGHLQFLTYMLVPLSVGMFPHLFQHWLTARSAKSFRLTVVCHPIFIGIVWLPCVLLGIWAVGAIGAGQLRAPSTSNALLGSMVAQLVHDPVITGLLTAGILAAIMSSLDSQFVCLGTMFTQDVVVHLFGEERFGDKTKVLLGRAFIVAIVALTYLLTFFPPPHIFDLGVWCFSGFASLFPLVLAALYWRRVTKAGAIASVLAAAACWGWLFWKGLVEHPTGDPEDFLIGGMMPVAILCAVSTAVLVVVSRLTTPPPDEVVDRFVGVGSR